MLESFIDFIAHTLGSLFVVLFIVCLIAFPVMWIWNWVMVATFGLPAIEYIQAIGLMILCDLLCKGNIGIRMDNGKN